MRVSLPLTRTHVASRYELGSYKDEFQLPPYSMMKIMANMAPIQVHAHAQIASFSLIVWMDDVNWVFFDLKLLRDCVMCDVCGVL